MMIIIIIMIKCRGCCRSLDSKLDYYGQGNKKRMEERERETSQCCSNHNVQVHGVFIIHILGHFNDF